MRSRPAASTRVPVYQPRYQARYKTAGLTAAENLLPTLRVLTEKERCHVLVTPVFSASSICRTVATGYAGGRAQYANTT